MNSSNIRNFSIIAHIDHGKSTLADRILEITGAVEKRKMKEQVLDSMELERERGITIKMQPVRMKFKDYILNLIDTPGHIDFNYEVSRALKAVEGAVLLVDATQGVQAQTITNVEMAKSLGLVIIPVLNKIDLPTARIDEVKKEVMEFLECGEEEILQASGKTGAGVEELLSEIIKRVPPPKEEIANGARALVFDFEYSLHQGIIVYVRVTDGEIKKGDQLKLYQAGEIFSASEIGVFSPEKEPVESLSAGEIGYIVTAVKKASIGTVGDTVVSVKESLSPLGGYMQPRPVVWASIYPESQEDLTEFRRSLERLKLSDSSLSFEEEQSGSMGRGFRCGFLGMLHLEIVIERLKREFNLNLVVATPTITYKVLLMDDKEVEIYSPNLFPEENLIKKVFEQWVDMQIIIPPDRLGGLMPLLYEHEAEVGEMEQFGKSRNIINAKMPLRELMRNFFDELKSVTSGYGSLSYKISGMREAPSGSIVKLDIYVAEEIIPAFSKIVSKARVEKDAEVAVDKLKDLIPRALFAIKIQAKALGRILASRSITPLKKDVTGYLYGGDITRKKKLWEKQKRGKEKLKKLGKGNVNIPQDVFVKMMQG
ncbi:MAG: elongation factor 4 [Candidatus Terrybacteria bacterium CG10_big_fil_rev_8_21_14_0_10_41_10]|uniref:Elongation factor 4 n=1 Tax=Candidatus Terrybacteria bacterium CG10_big_fil_rev_8_21_14_0_10_41_10 TaxID=1975026 RepID=A0A2M8LAE4_9BACT|nr:MAG: elongation factor 4 [Candidatus Terrybacteria bacterium CG10_big_fil_rev_8_21_14_0_10_41_10]